MMISHETNNNMYEGAQRKKHEQSQQTNCCRVTLIARTHNSQTFARAWRSTAQVLNNPLSSKSSVDLGSPGSGDASF